MCNGIDDGYSDGVCPVFAGYDPGEGDRSDFVIVGGTSPGDIISMGSGNGHLFAAQMLAFAEVIMSEMALPYHLLGPGGNCRPLFPRTRRRPEQTCQLPGCQKTTSHRGGYCCPEHCREHQAQRGKKVKAFGR